MISTFDDNSFSFTWYVWVPLCSVLISSKLKGFRFLRLGSVVVFKKHRHVNSKFYNVLNLPPQCCLYKRLWVTLKKIRKMRAHNNSCRLSSNEYIDKILTPLMSFQMVNSSSIETSQPFYISHSSVNSLPHCSPVISVITPSKWSTYINQVYETTFV